MTICRKCGKEIPDGQELCEECAKREASSGESYLDELMQSMGVFEDDIQEVPMSDSESEEELSIENLFVDSDMIEEEPTLEELFADGDKIEEPALEELFADGDTIEEPALEELFVDGDKIEEEPALEELFGAEEAVEETVEEPVMEELAESVPEKDFSGEEDINDLLNLLSKDYSEDFESDYEENLTEEESNIPEEPLPEVEMSLFNEEEGTIFADDTVASVDDVYQEALAAVEDFEEEDYEVVTEEPEAFEEGGSDDLEGLVLDDTSMVESDVLQILEEIPKKTKREKAVSEKKPPEESFWKKIFGNIITEQTAAEEAKERENEKENARKKAERKEEKRQETAATKEEKAQKAKEEKDRRNAQKAEQAARKKAEKDAKKRRRAELEAAEVVGKINPVGAAIVVIFFGLICLVVIMGTNGFSYRSAIRNAESDFEAREYETAYEALAGVEVAESSEELEEKVRICMQLQKEYNSFTNYYKLKMYLEALDSLMKGIRSYDENKENADLYGIMSQYNELEGKLAEALYTEFGVSETQAREINEIDKQEEYTEKLEEIIRNWQANIQQGE